MLRVCSAGRVPGVVVPQILLEFYATVTSGRRVATPLSSEQARAELEGFSRRLAVLPVPADSLAHLLAALTTHPRPGHGVFDLFLIAQMKSLGIGDVCTYNVSDFSYPGIRALEPDQALATYAPS